MTKHAITGLGPVNQDGSRKLFTVLNQPFIVSAAWLATHGTPEVGEDITQLPDGSLITTPPAPIVIPKAAAPVIEPEPEVETKTYSDGTTATGVAPLPAQSPAQQEAEKKSLGSAGVTGSESSPFKQYKSKPIVVTAAEIWDVSEPKSDGGIIVTFADESTKRATKEMTSRMLPQVGDYWVIVTQDDGDYEYLNPKAVFESKYAPNEE